MYLTWLKRLYIRNMLFFFPSKMRQSSGTEKPKYPDKFEYFQKEQEISPVSEWMLLKHVEESFISKQQYLPINSPSYRDLGESRSLILCFTWCRMEKGITFAFFLQNQVVQSFHSTRITLKTEVQGYLLPQTNIQALRPMA